MCVLSLSASPSDFFLCFGNSLLYDSIKHRAHLPPQDMIISRIHFFGSLATKMEVVTVAQQPDTRPGTLNQGQRALRFGGSNSNSAEPWGQRSPEWLSASRGSICRVLTTVSRCGLGCCMLHLSWCCSIFRVQFPSCSNDAVIYQISLQNVYFFSARISQTLSVAHTPKSLTIHTLGNLLPVFSGASRMSPQYRWF